MLVQHAQCDFCHGWMFGALSRGACGACALDEHHLWAQTLGTLDQTLETLSYQNWWFVWPKHATKLTSQLYSSHSSKKRGRSDVFSASEKIRFVMGPRRSVKS